MELLDANKTRRSIRKYQQTRISRKAPEAGKLRAGFGSPEIEYARGAQNGRSAKAHRCTQERRK